MAPFTLVYGTSSPLTDFLRHAATQEALRWWLIANGNTTVLADTELTEQTLLERNLILYGGPEDNRITRQIAPALPIRVLCNQLSLSDINLGDSLAAVLLFPNPLNPRKLVLVRMGTDTAITKLALSWNIIGSATGTPDFLIFDQSILSRGWAGVRAAGWFDPDWRFDPAAAFLKR